MQWLQQTMDYMQQFYMQNRTVSEVFAIVFLALLINFIELKIYRFMLPKTQKTKNDWDESILLAVHKPLSWFILLFGVSMAARHGLPFLDTLLKNGQKLLAIWMGAWAIVRFISKAEKILISSNKPEHQIERTTVEVISRLLRIAIIITAVIVGLQNANIDLTGLLAFGGVGTVIVGLAGKDLLAIFFGGMMIYFDRPFAVGDWIRSPDREIEGTVEYIGWRLCRIRTFDKRPLYIPNSIFSTISVENPSRMLNRRIRAEIGLRYDDATILEAVLKDIEAMLRNHPEIDTNQTLMVNLIRFGPSSLDFMVYTFTKTTDWVKFQAIQQDVFVKILEIVAQHGAEVAFPTQTVHVPDGLELLQPTTEGN